MSLAHAPEQRDDVVLRTRQSWQRTALGAAGVSLLAVRGFVIDGAPRWLTALAVLPGAVVVVLALVRNRGLARGRGQVPATWSPIGPVTVAVMAVALVGIVGTLLG